MERMAIAFSSHIIYNRKWIYFKGNKQKLTESPFVSPIITYDELIHIIFMILSFIVTMSNHSMKGESIFAIKRNKKVIKGNYTIYSMKVWSLCICHKI